MAKQRVAVLCETRVKRRVPSQISHSALAAMFLTRSEYGSRFHRLILLCILCNYPRSWCEYILARRSIVSRYV